MWADGIGMARRPFFWVLPPTAFTPPCVALSYVSPPRRRLAVEYYQRRTPKQNPSYVAVATGDPVQASADEPKSSRSSRRRSSSSSHSRSGAGTCWLNQMFSPSTNDHHFRWRNGSFSTFIGSIYDVTVVVGSARGSLPSTRLTCSSALPATALCWLSTTSHFAVAPLGLDLGASRSRSPATVTVCTMSKSTLPLSLSSV